MDKSIKKVIYAIAVILLVFIIGAFVALRQQQNSGTTGGGALPGGGATSQTRKNTSALVRQILPQGPIPSLSGTVLSINGNVIKVDVSQILGFNIPKEADIRTRSVFISDSAKLAERVKKPPEVFAKELERYQKNQAQGADLPLPYEFTKITPADLAAGDTIMFESGGIDIKTALSIQATSITRVR